MVIFILLVVVACKGKYDDLHAYVQQLQAERVSAPKDKIELLNRPVAEVYQSATARSPFIEPTSFAGHGSFESPLYAYPLNMMRFIGTISKDNQLHAYIWLPDNKVYQLKIGDNMGNHYGKIDAIFPDHIDVIERYFVAGKGDVQQKVILELKGEH